MFFIHNSANRMVYKILIFESAHKVMKADKLLSEMKLKFDIIPTPKEYSSDCGLSVRIDPETEDLKQIQNVLFKEGIIFNIYDKDYL
jgi:hypothetical protein